MKASKFTDAQKAFILKQGADGKPLAQICRKAGISRATYFTLLFALGLKTLRELFAGAIANQLTAFLAQLLSPKLRVKPLLYLAICSEVEYDAFEQIT